MSRRAGAALAAIAAGLALLAGCGGGGSETSGADTSPPAASTTEATTTEAPTAPAPSPPPSAPSRAQAVAFARTVGLRASDFPYYEAKPPEPKTATDRRRERALERCIGVEDRSELAKRDSPSFETSVGASFTEFGSDVSVYSSSAFVTREMDAIHRRGLECIARVLPAALEEAGSAEVDVVSTHTTLLRPPVPALGGSFGFRIRARVAIVPGAQQLTAYRPAADPQKTELDVYVDLIGFPFGPAEVGMTATAAPRPISRKLERRVLLLLAKRARAFDWNAASASG